MKFVISEVSLLTILIALITSSVKSQGNSESITNRVRNLKEEPITILDWLLGFTSRNVSRNIITSQTTNNYNYIPSSNNTTIVYAHEDFDNYSVSALAGFPQNISAGIPENTNQSHSQNVTQNIPRVGKQYFPPSRRRNPHPPITIIRNPGLVDYDSSNWPVPAPTEPTFNLYWNTNDVNSNDGDHNDFDEEEETQYNSDIDDRDPEVPIEEDFAESDDYKTSPSNYNSAHWKDTHNGRTRLKTNESKCTNSSCTTETITLKINSKQAAAIDQEIPATTTIASQTVSVDPDVPNTSIPPTALGESTLVPEVEVSGSTSLGPSIDPEVPSTTMPSGATNPGATMTDPEIPNTTTTSSATASLATTSSVDPEVTSQSLSTSTGTAPFTPVPSSTTTSTTPSPPSTETISSTTITVRPDTETTQTTPTPSSGTVTTATTVPPASTPAMPLTETTPNHLVTTTATSSLPNTNPQPTASPVPTAPLTPLPEASLPPPLNTEAPIITEPTTLPPVQAESIPTTTALATQAQTELVTEPGLPSVTDSPPPTEPQITDPPINAESPIIVPPTPPNITDPPTEPWFTDPTMVPNFTDPPTESNFTNPPTEPIFTDPPTEPIFTDPPTEPIFTDPPTTEPIFTDPPTEPIFTDPPTEPTFTDPPTEPWFTDPPTEPNFTDPPTEPWFTDPPTEAIFTDPPTEPTFTDPPFTETPFTDLPNTDPTTVPTFTDLPTEPPITDIPVTDPPAGTAVTPTDPPGTIDTTMRPMKPPPPFNATLRCQCGVQSTSAQTVGNTLIRLQTNPWLVEISVRGRHRCAGTLINDRYVLTAASCVRRIQKKSDLTVSSGLQSKFPVQHSVYKLSIHPKYDFKTMSNNVAVLGIKNPIEPGPSARPVCLPFTNPHSKYETASLSTWIYNPNQPRGRLSVLQSDVQLLNKTTCQSALNMTDSSPNRIGNGTFCAEAPAQRSCLGDTGGPLQAYVGKFSYEQIGLVSWGVGCRSSGLPGVYSMVRPYIRWMLFQMRDAHFCRDRRPKQEDLFKFFELEDQI